MKRNVLIVLTCVIITLMFAGTSIGQVKVGKTYYNSGRGDYSPDLEFAGKVRNCLGLIQKSLESSGMNMDNVVTAYCYLEDPENYAEFNEVYGEFFPNNPPTRTTMGVPHVPGDSRVEITCIAYDDLSEVKVIGTAPEGFPFSQGILAGTTLYISGKGDHLPDGSHPDTYEEQVRQAMRNVEAVLNEAGLDFRHVVMSHVFLDDYKDYGIMNKVYSEFFDYGNEPARATAFVDWLPGSSHVEITCIATTDLSQREVIRPPSMKYGPEGMAVTASPACRAGDTVYLSTISGFYPTEGLTTIDLPGQTLQMMKNAGDVLAAADMTFADVVSATVYLRDMDDYAPMNDIYYPHYTEGARVRTCLMPNSGYERDKRVYASFIAAKNAVSMRRRRE
ncbi:putative aminoacrylate peracid reductase RutC [subsurface metagenome]